MNPIRMMQCAVAGAIACALLPTVAAAQQPCGPPVQTAMATTVFEGPPTFSTGRGWTLSPARASLPKDALVFVCQRKTVGFMGSRQDWVRIQYKLSAEGTLQEGWIAARVLTGSHEVESWGFTLPSLWIGAAWAQGVDEQLPPPSNTPFLAMVFVAMLAGMAVKGLFDQLNDSIARHPKTYLKDTLKAFLVSPIVFLGFATGGDFPLTTHMSLFVFLCMAFQNGFFWQTILKSSHTSSPAPAPQGAPVVGGA